MQFEIASKLNGWSEETKAMELATSLSGTARAVLSDLKPAERLNFQSLVDKLTLRFEPKDLVGIYQAQLQSRRRKRNETIPELVQDINKLARQAFPTSDEGTRDSLAIHGCVKALADDQQELFVFRKDPKTVEEACRATMAYETFLADRPRQDREGAPAVFRQEYAPVTDGMHDKASILLDCVDRL